MRFPAAATGGPGGDTSNACSGDDEIPVATHGPPANLHAGAGMDIVQVIGDDGVTLNLTQAEVEIAQGGRGDDVFIGGGRYSVFVRGGDGADIRQASRGDDVLDGGADRIRSSVNQLLMNRRTSRIVRHTKRRAVAQCAQHAWR